MQDSVAQQLGAQSTLAPILHLSGRRDSCAYACSAVRILGHFALLPSKLYPCQSRSSLAARRAARNATVRNASRFQHGQRRRPLCRCAASLLCAALTLQAKPTVPPCTGFTERQVLSAGFLAERKASILQTRLQGAFEFLKTLEQDDSSLSGLERLARSLAEPKCIQHTNQVRRETAQVGVV